MTFDLVPVGGKPTTNLVVNGDFELGTPEPASWGAENGAVRAFPGLKSTSALELGKTGARALTGLALPVGPFDRLDVSVAVRAQGLRGAGGAAASLFFLDDSGRPLPEPIGSAPLFRWAGTFDWRDQNVSVPVPQGAVRAVIQFEKSDGTGAVFLDDVGVTASPNAEAGSWTPYHVEDDTSGWTAVQPSPSIAAKSALDASFLLDAPAGKHGFVTVRDGRLAFTRGGRARFFGVALLAPAAFLEPERADALADRLARSGINLVRLGDLDTPVGPNRSLLDDSRDDTRAFDPVALERLDHLVAALKTRGIYVALELQSARRFRSEDGVKDIGLLPLGGGPAAVFDPVIGKHEREFARALLGHVNKETGLPLRDDPVLAWVTLAGELSLFDQLDQKSSLPKPYADELRALAQKGAGTLGRRFWQATEAAHWKELADELRRDKLRVPIASVSHWRREPEFAEAVGAQGFDLVDDRLYFAPPPFFSPDRRSMLWALDGAIALDASKKRKPDRPYTVGQWCFYTQGAWAVPYEGADVMLASAIASAEDWDALVRRGVFVYPEIWGSASAGTGGGEDIFQIPEVVNGIPQVYALWPHAASMMLRGSRPAEKQATSPRHTPRHGRFTVPGWEPARGRLLIDTPCTQGIAGWTGGDPAGFDALAIATDTPFAVVVASSAGTEPIDKTDRLLVTAVARVQPTGVRWVDSWKREVADPGRPPLLQEPVTAKVRWLRKGRVRAYALDNTGARGAEVKLEAVPGGVELVIDGLSPTLHWELVAE
jgi:hypothetical protein